MTARSGQSTIDVAIVGSGFAGSLLARILAKLGYEVALLERGTHPRFAIGESSTPMANLTLERLGARYGLDDCRALATHGRWLAEHPELMRGLKRGFTYYRHHPGAAFADRGRATERLLVAASPDDAIADSHWLRAGVDHHFVREAVAAGVAYRDRVALRRASFDAGGARLEGESGGGDAVDLRARFVVDATGPGGFLARQIGLPPALDHTETRSALVFSHFANVGMMAERFPALPDGPYPDDWAAVHHLIDEGWMYSLRFDDGVTSAGFLLSPRGLSSLGRALLDPASCWASLLDRYPTIGALFGDAAPLFPIRFVPQVQHRLATAAGARWALLPHAYAFVDPLFSTGIAWGLRGVERLALLFEKARSGTGIPDERSLAAYDSLLGAEADQADRLVAGAYDAMAHFELFAAYAMIYFAIVSFGEVQQRFSPAESWAWSGFLGVGDPISGPLVGAARERVREITRGAGDPGTAAEREAFARWVADAIAPRNIAGLADASRRNLYPVDLETLIDRHALLGIERAALIERLPLPRGMAASL